MSMITVVVVVVVEAAAEGEVNNCCLAPADDLAIVDLSANRICENWGNSSFYRLLWWSWAEAVGLELLELGPKYILRPMDS